MLHGFNWSKRCLLYSTRFSWTPKIPQIHIKWYTLPVYMHGKWTQLCTTSFTKLLKPVYATLHNLGYLSLGHIDDSYLQGDTSSECLKNVKVTASLFKKVGFHLHPTKSVIIPIQRLTFLEFVLDSNDMTVTPTESKIQKVVTACQHLLTKHNPYDNRSCRSDRAYSIQLSWSPIWATTLPFTGVWQNPSTANKQRGTTNPICN